MHKWRLNAPYCKTSTSITNSSLLADMYTVTYFIGNDLFTKYTRPHLYDNDTDRINITTQRSYCAIITIIILNAKYIENFFFIVYRMLFFLRIH